MMTSSKLIQIASQYRAWVRKQCRAPGHYPIRIVAGGAAPTKTGDSWYYETRTGMRIYHLAAYRKRGWSSMVYCSSTIEVTVGREWLASRRIPLWTMCPTRDADELVALGAFGAVGQGARLVGMDAERIAAEIGAVQSC